MVPLNALLSAIVANVDLAPRAGEPREWGPGTWLVLCPCVWWFCVELLRCEIVASMARGARKLISTQVLLPGPPGAVAARVERGPVGGPRALARHVLVRDGPGGVGRRLGVGRE